MKLNKHFLLKSIGLSVGLSLLLAFISAFSLIAGAMMSTNSFLITKILLWNVVLAVYLIELGLLPACQDCEMAILLYVIFYGFIIGLIGYSIAIFGGILLIEKSRRLYVPR